MINTESAIAYRCPSCSEEVFGTVSVFRHDSGKVKLKCACGNSELEAVIGDDGKVRLIVPCVFCPKPHHYTLDKDVFFSGELFLLACPSTSMPSCFIGPAKQVSDAVEENEKEIRRIAAEAGIDIDGGVGIKDMTLSADGLRETVVRLLGMLKNEKRIICNCEDEKNGDLSLTVTPDSVEIACRKCGAKRYFRAETTLDCEYLADIDLLYLE